MKVLKVLSIVALALLMSAALALATAVLILLDPGDGRPWTIRLPVVRGMQLEVNAEPLLRAATSPLGRRLLAGTQWRTRNGRLRFENRDGGLLAVCTDCRLRLPRFSAAPLEFTELALQIRRSDVHVAGWLLANAGATDGAATRVLFHGELSPEGLALDWHLQKTGIARVAGLVRTAVPEAERAEIRGSLAASGTLRLPSLQWTARPQIEGFEVHGLGTEALRYGAFRYVCRDADGQPQMRQTGEGTPGWMTIKRMGKWLPRAVLAAEDARFYQHPGYDLEELLPLLADAGRGERSMRRGASTITQQLAKNFFVGGEATGARKLRELLYAVEMERTLGKKRILALYLNTVDWGPGICGAQEAGQVYFERELRKLTAAESAWMGGILRNPHRAYRNEFLAGRPDDRRLQWMMAQMPRRAFADRSGKAGAVKVNWRPDARHAK